MITPERRELLVRKFLRLGRSLEGALPGKEPRAESEMARLVSAFDRQLLEIAASATGDAELQLAAWLRDLASLPAGSTINKEFTWIRVSLQLLPRTRGSFVLDAPTYPIPGRPLTRNE
jgi:hypothetical protein